MDVSYFFKYRAVVQFGRTLVLGTRGFAGPSPVRSIWIEKSINMLVWWNRYTQGTFS